MMVKETANDKNTGCDKMTDYIMVSSILRERKI